jgi:DNA-binding CsgD family transcriptional regulator
MTVFGTDMHIVTFAFVIIEVLFFIQQLTFYIQRPSEKRRKYYLILLGLLIAYNITGGLFPDPRIPIPINLQWNLAYGAGFLTGAYFPFYFYKAFDIKELGWHAKYGVLIFLVAPFLLFFSIILPIYGDVERVIWYGLAIPLVYAFFLIAQILFLIKKKYSSHPFSFEAILTYSATAPWALLPVFSYAGTSQLVEVVTTNCGLIIITYIFLKNILEQNRKDFERLNYLDRKETETREIFLVAKFDELSLTKRERDVADLMLGAMTSKKIADSLFISEGTVNKHIQSIYRKSSTKNRLDFINSIKEGL